MHTTHTYCIHYAGMSCITRNHSVCGAPYEMIPFHICNVWVLIYAVCCISLGICMAIRWYEAQSVYVGIHKSLSYQAYIFWQDCTPTQLKTHSTEHACTLPSPEMQFHPQPQVHTLPSSSLFTMYMLTRALQPDYKTYWEHILLLKLQRSVFIINFIACCIST